MRARLYYNRIAGVWGMILEDVRTIEPGDVPIVAMYTFNNDGTIIRTEPCTPGGDNEKVITYGGFLEDIKNATL